MNATPIADRDAYEADGFIVVRDPCSGRKKWKRRPRRRTPCCRAAT